MAKGLLRRGKRVKYQHVQKIGQLEHLEERRLLSSVSGVVFNDSSGDGVRQDGEAGLANWQVFIDRSGDGQRQDGEPMLTTTSTGGFIFRELPAGTYRIAEILKPGFAQTAPAGGSFNVQLAAFQAASVAFGNKSTEPLRGAIRGNVFNDVDGNGARASTEAGLGGWTVYLDTSGDGNRQDGEPTTTTGQDGRYAFEGLVAGTYHVREVVQNGWNQTLPQTGVYDVNLTAGQNVGDQNFGDHHVELPPPPPTGTIRGMVFSDTSGDGVRQDGEPGLQGWQIYLDTSGDGSRQEGEPTRTTGADGRYAFEGLTPGNYSVREVVQPGFAQTGPVGGAYAVTVAGGQTIADQNFGDKRVETPPTTGSVRGMVFSDTSGDGARQDGEPGLQGWLVYLDTSGDGSRQDGEPTRTTGADGKYAFEGLAPGNYSVREVVQSGFTQTGPVGGAYAVTVVAGQSINDRNFGDKRIETPPTTGTIRGMVFSDTSGDGVRQDGEPGLPGWQVYLDTSGDGNRQDGEPTRTTGPDGKYAFEGTAAGPYSVREVVQSGFTQTGPVGGAYSVTVVAGQTIADRNFGDKRNDVPPPPTTGNIRGVVFNDIDSDGTRDAGEAGLGGWQVYLDTSGDGNRQDGEPTRATNGDGAYAFEGITPGNYSVREVVQAGFTQTGPVGGAYGVTVVAGQTVGDRNFGDHRNETPAPASIRGVVFIDTDSDGTRDDGEVGLGGWVVYLDTSGDGNRQDGEPTRTTSLDGRYTFDGLAAGSYSVREVPQAGFNQTGPVGGVYAVTLAAGQAANDNNFGNHRIEHPLPAAIRGVVFSDTSGDGTQQAGEAGLPGWTVFIDADKDGNLDEGERRTTTGDGGRYAFENLAAGTYRIAEVLQTGFTQTGPATVFYDVTLVAGQNVGDRNFGDRRNDTPPPPTTTGAISGRVFNDISGDGVRQDGEGAIYRWQIYIDANTNGRFDEGEQSTFTNTIGGWRFSGLVAGQYVVRARPVTGWQQTAPGPDGGFTVTLATGQVTEGLLFGEHRITTPALVRSRL